LEYPVKSFMDAGAVIATGSDYPVTIPPYPLEGVQIGITRTVPETTDGKLSYGLLTDPSDPKYKLPLWPEESVTLQDMLASVTYNAAWASGYEDIIGSLEVGKSADFIIMDGNVFETAPEKLRDISVLNTYFRGQEVYKK
jgi:predicted amidohydrolase YtcJ